jgi:hypothetical protein
LQGLSIPLYFVFYFGNSEATNPSDRVASKFVVDSADPKSESSEQCTCVECRRGGNYSTTENGLLNALHELIDLSAPGKDASDNLREAVNSDDTSSLVIAS